MRVLAVAIVIGLMGGSAAWAETKPAPIGPQVENTLKQTNPAPQMGASEPVQRGASYPPEQTAQTPPAHNNMAPQNAAPQPNQVKEGTMKFGDKELKCTQGASGATVCN